MEKRRLVLGIILIVLVLVAIVLVVRPYETVVVTESQTVAVPYETERIESAELPVGTEAVVRAGKDGRRVVYTYFEERRFLGTVTSRTQVPANGRPAGRVEAAPVTQTVEYGTATEFASDLSASAESGVDIGAIGPAGTMLIQASGVITYMKGSNTGPVGDPVHDYTFIPLMPEENVGALLVRLGDGTYTAYGDLPLSNGMRVVSGMPGQRVRAVVNDAPGLYEDNTGTLRIRVIVR
ncbi:MAG: G5 domain-containing protein [Coriobacteriia bacterium]